MRKGIAANLSLRQRCYLTGSYCFLAEGLAKTGQTEQGLETLAEALAMVEETGERYCEAELHRLRGKLLLVQGEQEAAQASLEQAIQVARRQEARSWELRAAIDLARLWRGQAKLDLARQALSEVYSWFSEGFDTPDLIEARRILEQIA